VRDEINQAAQDESAVPGAGTVPGTEAAIAPAAEDAAAGASPAAEGPVDDPEHQERFKKAYHSFYTVEDPGAPKAGETTAAESPEDAHLREREQGAGGENTVTAEDPKAGLYLLRSGGRGGGRGGPYSFSPQPPPKPEGDGAENASGTAAKAERASSADKV
jgi:hypothetical protein